MAELYCGTSGFAYPSWKPDFYPAEVPARKFLSCYAERLNAVEINYTFRRLPAPATLEAWVKATPPAFVFALKAHMRITHVQRLQPAEFTSLFFKAIDPLRTAGRLGPILFQLPPGFRCDLPALARFLAELPPGLKIAFEFRHASWLSDPIYDLLAQHGVALCLAESEKLVVPEVITAGFVYSRLRKDDYTMEDRQEIAARAEQVLTGGGDSYVFFKHEDTPAGALYAEELLRRLRANRRT